MAINPIHTHMRFTFSVRSNVINANFPFVTHYDHLVIEKV